MRGGGRWMLRLLLWNLAFGVLPFGTVSAASGAGTAPTTTGQRFEGVVFGDANGNGLRDAGEAPLAGIAVSNGRHVVLTDEDGRYGLPHSAGAFVSVTCPDDGRCDLPWRSDSGDFAVVPEPEPDDFFFVQISDLHGYRTPEDLRELPSPEDIPWWMPRYAAGWYVLRSLTRMYRQYERDEIVEALRSAAAPHRDLSRAWGPTVVIEYFDAAMDSKTGMIDPAGDMRRALDEVEALRPSFVVNTGDFILDGNEVRPEVAAAWFRQYAELIASLGFPIYTTIGNNELVATDHRDDLEASDPRYGKGLFRSLRGPTHFSFDRGRLHFVALDTHRLEKEQAGADLWEYGRMEPAVREWLEADLLATDRAAAVVLNHEPFHESPGWDLIGGPISDDEGLFDAHRVPYALSGHIHKNGFEDGEYTSHITTGSISGFRWALPATLDERGYRLFYAKGERLYSAFKRLGEPVLGFVDPPGEGANHPASKAPMDPSALSGVVEVVIVAADASGPFADIGLSLNGEPLVLERWGDYFGRARFDADALPEGRGSLVLSVRDAAGAERRSALAVARSSGD